MIKNCGQRSQRSTCLTMKGNKSSHPLIDRLSWCSKVGQYQLPTTNTTHGQHIDWEAPCILVGYVLFACGASAGARTFLSQMEVPLGVAVRHVVVTIMHWKSRWAYSSAFPMHDDGFLLTLLSELLIFYSEFRRKGLHGTSRKEDTRLTKCFESYRSTGP